MKDSNKHAFVISFIFLLAAGVILWELLAHPFSDDWFYMNTFIGASPEWFFSPGDPITTFSQAWDSAVSHYLYMNCRLANTLCYFSFLLPTAVVDTFCGLMIMAMLAMIATCATKGFRWLKSPLVITAAATLMWTTLPWYDNMMSRDFQLNYVLSTTLLLWFLYIYIYKPTSSSRLATIGCCALSFVAATMHEGMTLPAIAAAALLFFADKSQRRSRLPLLIAFSAGMLYLLGPGTFERIDGHTSAIGIDGFVKIFASRALLALLPWLIPAAVATLLAATRGRRFAIDAIKSEWPWIVIAATNYVIGYAICNVIRGLWIMDIALIIITLHLALQCRPLPERTKTATAALLAILNIAFIIGVDIVQHRFTTEFNYTLSLVKDHGHRAFYSRMNSQEAAPWWTFGLPCRIDGHDAIAMLTFSSAMDPSHHIVYPFLPDACRDLPFDQWTKVAGDNPFRGEYPFLYSRCNDSLVVEVKVAEPLPSMPPLSRVLAALSGNDTARHIKLRPDTIWNGDSGAIYQYILPTMPRTIKNRRFISIDVVEHSK